MFSPMSTAKLLEAETGPRHVVKTSSINTVQRSQAKSFFQKVVTSFLEPLVGPQTQPRQRAGHYGQAGDLCDLVPKGSHTHVVTPPASGTNFTFFVLVFSASKDSVSFTCLRIPVASPACLGTSYSESAVPPH